MPNIGAFIAWGLITALFIPVGWLPNEDFAKLVGPMIIYLLPLLIGYAGGKAVHGTRGGVVGAIATMGVIVGTSIPMFLGAMIMGPLSGWVIKKVDGALQPKIRQGFEMLVNNFTAGIVAGALALVSLKAIGPTVEALNKVLANGVNAFVDSGLLPLASIFIEPAKVLFLNNAINHGILSPLGTEEAAKVGKSILFMLETNPGPGLGILLAYWLFGKGASKATAPGAIIIHFFGGIHEIYFPYILMRPVLIVAAILGGMTGVATFSMLDLGLVAPPSPGSIFAYMAMVPKGGGHLAIIFGILLSALVSFLVASFLLKRSKQTDDESLEDAAKKVQELKGKKSDVVQNLVSKSTKIVFACDAGMGSSAMGASTLRNKAKQAGLNLDVTNYAIQSIPADAEIVISHKDLTPSAQAKAPNATHISVDNFLASPEYDKLIASLQN